MGLTRIRAEQISDIDYKQAVRVITLANITLSGGAPSTVDGVNLVADDRVLVAGQGTGSQNGLYYVQTVGAGSNGTWVRSTDGNETGEIEAGMIVMVTEGDVYKDTQWKLTTNNPIIIGTTPLVFEQNSAFAFGNIYANGTAVLATSVGGTVSFAAGTNITIIGNNTSKTVTFSASGGGGSGTPGGADTNVQFNDGGSFGGTAGFTFDKTTNAVSTTGTVSATGNIQGGNLLTSGLISATGNVISGNLSTTLVTATTLSVTGNVSGGNLNVTGNIVDTGALSVITGSNGNLTLIPDGTGLIVFNKDVRNGQANGVGNIGSSTGYFNTIFAKATSAQYADLAEIYITDADYPAGTVVVFGGDQEITQSFYYAQPSVAGVISTNPAYIMNAGSEGLPVALQGRVPCRVVGTIRKGDLVAASEIAGVATRLDPQDWTPGSVIGKALGDHNSNDEGMIEVVVGRV